MLLWREKGRSPSHQEGQGLPVEEEDLKKNGMVVEGGTGRLLVRSRTEG